MHSITDPEILQAIGRVAILVKGIALKFSFIIAVVMGTIGVIRFYIRVDSTLQFKKFVLIPLLIILGIRYYPVIIDYTSFVGDKIITAMGGNKDYETTMKKFLEIQAAMAPKPDKEEDAPKDEEGGFFSDLADGITGVMTDISDALTSSFDFMARAVQTFIIFIVRFVIEKIRNLLLGFLICTGPIALLLELVPSLRGTFLEWFRNFLSVMFWAATLAVLDNIVHAYALNVAAKVSEMEHISHAYVNSMDWVMRFINNLVITSMYVLTPTLTSLYMGNNGTSSIMSKTIGFVSLGAMTAYKKGRSVATSAAKKVEYQ